MKVLQKLNKMINIVNTKQKRQNGIQRIFREKEAFIRKFWV